MPLSTAVVLSTEKSVDLLHCLMFVVMTDVTDRSDDHGVALMRALIAIEFEIAAGPVEGRTGASGGRGRTIVGRRAKSTT